MSALDNLKHYVLGIYNLQSVVIDEIEKMFDECEGHHVDEVVHAYNEGINEGAKHIEAWKALAAACELVMAARMEENEAYDKAEDNHISDTWVLGKAVHTAEDLAEWRAEWAAADTRLLDAETVLREARAVVRDLEK